LNAGTGGYHARATMDPELLSSFVTHARRSDQQLMADLLAHCWPGGPSDRTAPIAREWLRRWTPRRLALEFTACECPVERCGCAN
jgi:hypothetical protein